MFFDALNYFIGLGKRRREADNVGVEPLPAPKRQKLEPTVTVTLPLEMHAKIALFLGGVDKINFITALKADSPNAITTGYREANLLPKARDAYYKEPMSLAEAKSLFKIEAVAQANYVESFNRSFRHIGQPNIKGVASSIKAFREIEQWIYDANFEVVKNEIEKQIKKAGRTVLDLRHKKLRYFPLESLLRDKETAASVLKLTILDLSRNEVINPITPELSQLVNLKFLYTHDKTYLDPMNDPLSAAGLKNKARSR